MMIDKERLDLYKTWFDNMSFFGHNSFILDTIEDLWNLTNYIIGKYRDFCNYNIDKNTTYTNMTKEDTITLVKHFLSSHDINLKLKKLIEDGVLMLENDVFETKDVNNFFNCKKDGFSHYDKDNKKIMFINMENTIFDGATMVHELMHYRNQPDNKRNFISDLLTEALSYGVELIFFEDLKDTIYHEDRSLHFKLFEKLMYNYMYRIRYIYKIILLYKRTKDINEDLYNEIFDDGDYEITMKYFDLYVQQRECILQNTWMVIGLPLAIYILEEYKKDHNFFNSVELFNSSLNTKSLDDCLRALKINNQDDLKAKIKCSNNSFIESLRKLYGNWEKNEESKKPYQLEYKNLRC